MEIYSTDKSSKVWSNREFVVAVVGLFSNRIGGGYLI